MKGISFLILLEAFFFLLENEKLFGEAAHSLSLHTEDLKAFFPNQKWHKYKIQQVTLNLWRVM